MNRLDYWSETQQGNDIWVGFPQGSFVANGAVWEIQVATIDGNSCVGPYSDSIVLQARTFPTISSVTPANNATGVAQHPQVSWTPALASDAAQTAWRVQLSGVSGPVWDSGVVYGPATSCQLPWLPASSLFEAEVTVTQSGGQTATASTGFTTAGTSVAAPTVLPLPSPPLQPPSVEMIVGCSTPGAVVGDVQRSTDGGTTWSSAPGAQGAPLGPVVDPEPPPGVDIVYRVCAGSADGTSRSPWLLLPPVQVDPFGADLWDRTTGTSVPVLVTDNPQVGKSDRQGVYAQEGVSLSTVLSDAIGSDTPQIPVTWLDEPSWQAFLAIRASQRPLLWRDGTADQWWVRLGDFTVTKLDRSGVRQATVAMTQVAAPPVEADATL